MITAIFVFLGHVGGTSFLEATKSCSQEVRSLAALKEEIRPELAGAWV